MSLLIVDNSNIFITLKQQYADDLSVRFDCEKFAKDFVSFPNLQKVIVGSTPPKTDSFWNFMRDKGWEVYTYERSKSGGEKGVDTKVVTCGMRFINECKNKGVRGHLHTMSGDRDMLPLIEDAVKDGCDVTLITWKSSISREYIHGDIGDKITIRYLDDISGDLIFFETTINGKKNKQTLNEWERKSDELEERVLGDIKNKDDLKKAIAKLKSGQNPTDDEWQKVSGNIAKIMKIAIGVIGVIGIVGATVLAFLTS